MTARAVRPPSLASDVVTELKSPTTTTDRTVELLRSLLGLDTNSKGIRAAPKRPQILKPVKTARPPKASSSNAKGQTKDELSAQFEIYGSVENNASPLPGAAKVKLATEAFNAGLRSLTELVKKKSPSEHVANSDNAYTSICTVDSKTKPLQNRSPNRKDPRSSKTCRKDSMTVDVKAIAECAVLALHYLQSDERNNSTGDKGSAALQQQGSLMVLDRLITLGLEDKATALAVDIYHQHQDQPYAPNAKQKKLTKAEFTNFVATVIPRESASDFTFVTSFQGQLLRLFILQYASTDMANLAKQMNLETEGSPANNVVKGEKCGHIKREKAGLQLRTIAQALLKIYTNASQLKVGKSNISQSPFTILVQSFIIKIKSWQFLGHKPQLDKELWAHVVRAGKQTLADNVACSKGQRTAIMENFKSLQSVLTDCAFSSGMPEFAALYLVDLAEQNEDFDIALGLLENYVCSVDVKQLKSPSIQWRKTILIHKSGKKSIRETLEAFNSANDILKKTEGGHPSIEPSLTLLGVRLRKASVAEILTSTQHDNQGEDPQSNDRLIGCCIEVLKGLLESSFKQCSNIIACAKLQDKGQGTDQQTKLMALAKSLEAVLDAGHAYVLGLSMLRGCYLSSLKLCAKALSFLQIAAQGPMHRDERLTSFVDSLSIRLSNQFWQCYISTVSTSGHPADFPTELDNAIAVVKCCQLNVQKAASLGTKLQQRGVVHLKLGNYELSCKAFTETLQFYVQSGLLVELVNEEISRVPEDIEAEKRAVGVPLKKVLKLYTDLVRSHGPACQLSGTFYYDDVELPIMQRCILLETQILASIEHSFSQEQGNALRDCVHKMLLMASGPEFHVYRIRLLLRLLHSASKYPLFPARVVVTDELVKQVCEPSHQEANTMHLGQYQLWLSSALRLQWNLENGCPNAEEIHALAQQICTMVLSTANQSALQAIIDDVALCVKQLQALLAYMQAIDQLQVMIRCETAICHILKLSPSSQTGEQLLSHLSSLCLMHNRCGDMSEAKECLMIAQRLLVGAQVPSTARIRHSLANTEYLLNNDDVSSALKMFLQARDDFSALFPKSVVLSGRSRFEHDTILTQSALIATQIAYRYGRLDLVSLFSRQAIKISTNTWQAIEKGHKAKEFPSEDSSIQDLSVNMSSLAVSTPGRQVATMTSNNGSFYWNLMPLHCSALTGIGAISLQNGLYQDALYYLEQLHKVSQSTRSSAFTYRASIALGCLYAVAGDLQKAEHYTMIERPSDMHRRALDNVETTLSTIEVLINLGKHENARAHLADLKKSLDREKNNAIQVVSTKNLVAPTRRETKQNQTRAISAAPKRVPRKATARKEEQPVKPVSEVTFQQLCLEEMLTFFDSVLSPEKETATSSLRARFDSSQVSTGATFPQAQRLLVEKLLDQALAEMSADAVKCVLAETAVALPVKTSVRRASARVSLIQSDQAPLKTKGRSVQRTKLGAVKEFALEQIAPGEQLMRDAYHLLQSTKDTQYTRSSTNDLHMHGKLETKLSLFGSTMQAPFTLSSLDIVLGLLQSKEVVTKRNHLVTMSESLTKSRDQVLAWPTLDPIEMERNSKVTKIETVTAADVAGIPSTWNMISFSLAENGTEILLSKVVADQSPFMLRIPLSRSDLEIGDEPEFTYHSAKCEFDAIISRTNASCHDRRGQGDKQARQAWYQERLHLDQQLGDWLSNIENVWLGGFRGLLSPVCFDEKTRLTFDKALARALDKHLPSRQRQVSKKQGSKVELHHHVIDLFLGLGDPESQDLDDAITDLLYFVIDILQFSGEQNAYDEIDFDALVVDIVDALRACHESILAQEPLSIQHTILILDKELEAFPWESLPCLQHQSISRMPSLRAIVQRLESIRAQNGSVQGYAISGTKGAYMLNPSSDLPSTESTFRPILEQNLSSFTSTICTPPTEASFESMLRDHDLFLYFGHGSGAQYIRGRTIRAMETCAVTLLMGCSSAKMTECGQLESHGMPGCYIGGMSNCMAMVGTLWDVTDRDIDRFAVKLLVEWGLVEDNDLVQKVLERSTRKGTTAKEKCRTKTAKSSHRKERSRLNVSLDQAVSQSRGACLLRYLNGAAPVIYGVPVYLS